MQRPKLGHAVALVLLLSWAFARPVGAQDATAGPSPFLADIARKVVLDPTTYAPGVLLYESMHLDWSSSQPLFHAGYVEDNERYTVNGLPHDTPVSYAEGNRRILRDALAVLPVTALHNVTNRAFERLLLDRYPEHGRLIRTLGWVERVSAASYLSYRLSAGHFHQWKINEANIVVY